LAPKHLFADNGVDFTGQLVDLLAYHNATRIDFPAPESLPTKPLSRPPIACCTTNA
jgi:putative transposase